MPVSFSQIPAEIKVPLYWVEVDPSKAGLPVLKQPALLVGTMLTIGTAAPDIPLVIGSQAQADDAFGQGSELARMFRAFYANNVSGIVYGLGVVEPVAATAATGTITVATAPTEAGTIHLYIGGTHVPVNVGASDTVNEIHTAISFAINDNPDLPVTSTGGPTDVTITAVWKGISGDEISVAMNYYGTVGGESTPVGLDITLPVTGMLTGGAGVPAFDTAIDNLGEHEFEYVAMPYTDATSLTAWEDEYGFSDAGRWGWQRELFGHVFSAKRGTYPNLLAFGETRNSGVMSVLGFEVASLSPAFEWVAAYTGKAQRALLDDPARPLQSLSLNQIKPAPLNSQFRFSELNGLALSGVAIQKTPTGSNVPLLAREQTTYQRNLYGQPDDAYELVTTLATLARLLRNQKQAITSKYARCKLANDGTRFGPGQAILTPGLAKAELVAQYRQDEFDGLVEDTQNFKNNLLVERDTNDPNRLNVLYPPDLINQCRIFAVLAQFRLQYDRGLDSEIIGPPVGVTGIAA
jgi:phage tail sheath gpL-like